MADIRPLERSDLAEVTALLRKQMPGWALNEEVLEATVLEHPWSEEALPSLVAVGEDGAVIGFIGAQARRMRFDGEPIRGVCCTQLAVAADQRAGAVGALLLRRLLSGPQDVTWSDSATDVVVRLWQAFGGLTDHSRAADFMLVLRPWRWAGGVLRARLTGQTVGRRLVPVGAFPFQAVGGTLTRRPDVSAAAEVEGSEVTAAVVAEHLPALSKHLTVSVDWDEAELVHMLGQVDAVEGGLACRVVRRGDREIGWYAYLRRPGGVSRLLHLAAAKRAADDVLGELIEDATASGSAVLAGRAEPHLEWSLRRRHAALGFARQPIIRAVDPSLAAALGTSASLLTRLDGEVFAI